MKLNTLLTLSLMAVFAVSCAHKNIKQDTSEPALEPVVKQDTHKEVKKEENQSKQIKSNNDLSLSCVLGKDSRIITIQKGDKRCEVHYTKDGNLNQVAWGEKTPSICDDVFKNVKTNIEKGGFKCNENNTTAGL